MIAIEKCGILSIWETREPKAAYPPVRFRRGNPPDERKEGMLMNVTYGDLFQFCIFVVSLVGLCYTVFKGRK